MKNKRIFFLFLILSVVFMLNIKLYAVTTPWFTISSNKYSEGDKVNLSENCEVEVDKTLQLYGMIIFGNEMMVNNKPDSIGIFVSESNLTGITWTSNDTNIATVDNTGKVTGIAEGKAIITAIYNEEKSECEVNVKTKEAEEYTGIIFDHNVPETAKILNTEKSFWIYLYNIPYTEKENIKIIIDNEEIAKLEEVYSGSSGNDHEKRTIIVKVKFLKLGTTKMTATLNYNGKTYTDSYDLDVIDSIYKLLLSTEEDTNLLSTLEVGEKIQLKAMLEIYGGSVLPMNVTLNGVTYTSSDEKIAKVDDKGLITAIGEGTTIITAKYERESETITATYNLKVTDSTKLPNQQWNESNNDKTIVPDKVLPQTGVNITIFIASISIIIFAIFKYIKYREYRDVK